MCSVVGSAFVYLLPQPRRSGDSVVTCRFMLGAGLAAWCGCRQESDHASNDTDDPDEFVCSSHGMFLSS
jgi:hypothetical protein